MKRLIPAALMFTLGSLGATSSGLTRQLFLDVDETTVPEPAALLLAGAVLTGFAIWRRRRRA